MESFFLFERRVIREEHEGFQGCIEYGVHGAILSF